MMALGVNGRVKALLLVKFQVHPCRVEVVKYRYDTLEATVLDRPVCIYSPEGPPTSCSRFLAIE